MAEAEGEAWAKDVLNDVAFEIISFLGTVQHVRDVRVKAKQPASAQLISNWERSNFPHKLPQELREFYQRVNGFELSWNVGINDCVFPVGAISINSIEKLKAAPVAHLTQATKAASNAIVASFVIEELEQGAKVLVALRQQSGPVETTEVWLWDPVLRAHKIAESFTAYLRLAVMHLGIAKWQWAFTPHGVPTASENWMRLLCPERLAIDLKAQQARLEAEEKGKSERPVPTQAAEDESPRSQPTSEFRLDFSSLPEDKDPRAAAATTSTAPAAATSTGTSGGTNGRPITRSRTPKSARDTPSRTNKSRR